MMPLLVILTPGTNQIEKGVVRDSIFRGHRKNIGKLAESGKLVIAGPFVSAALGEYLKIQRSITKKNF